MTINARAEEDVEPECIMQKVARASGANYAFHKESSRFQDTGPQAPVVSAAWARGWQARSQQTGWFLPRGAGLLPAWLPVPEPDHGADGDPGPDGSRSCPLVGQVLVGLRSSSLPCLGVPLAVLEPLTPQGQSSHEATAPACPAQSRMVGSMEELVVDGQAPPSQGQTRDTPVMGSPVPRGTPGVCGDFSGHCHGGQLSEAGGRASIRRGLVQPETPSALPGGFQGLRAVLLLAGHCPHGCCWCPVLPRAAP